MTRQRSAFDIIGPVMIGPSSSHTAGAVRLGGLARAFFGEQPVRARIVLHGSFATTGRGHGTDLALVAGLLGFAPDDPAIREALNVAPSRGLEVVFTTGDLGDVHPNTAAFELESADGHSMRLSGSSLGGGDVVLTSLDDFDIEATGELPLLVITHADRPGEIAAVTAILAQHDTNIAAMRVSRRARGAAALMLIETDAEVSQEVLRALAAVPGVTDVRAVPPV
jgi:L-serine dehydratase